ncbi:hypothetical protein NMG60_11036418 [Bertholletia excelsa]
MNRHGSSTSTSASSSSWSCWKSPCSACKFLRRKCQAESCVFAPYFPPDQPHKFANVHKVFGSSNVSKMLNELHPEQREDAANSLAYEAEMRLRDPIYGCVGVISLLHYQLSQIQLELSAAKSQLSCSSKYHPNHNLIVYHQLPQPLHATINDMVDAGGGSGNYNNTGASVSHFPLTAYYNHHQAAPGAASPDRPPTPCARPSFQ